MTKKLNFIYMGHVFYIPYLYNINARYFFTTSGGTFLNDQF